MTSKELKDSRSREMFSKVEAYLSGDLTQQQFCEEQGFAKSTFQYWLRKYRKFHNTGNVSSGDFIPVRLGSINGHQTTPINCEIEMPGKLVIRFHSASLNSSLTNLIHSLVD